MYESIREKYPDIWNGIKWFAKSFKKVGEFDEVVSEALCYWFANEKHRRELDELTEAEDHERIKRRTMNHLNNIRRKEEKIHSRNAAVDDMEYLLGTVACEDEEESDEDKCFFGSNITPSEAAEMGLSFKMIDDIIDGTYKANVEGKAKYGYRWIDTRLDNDTYAMMFSVNSAYDDMQNWAKPYLRLPVECHMSYSAKAVLRDMGVEDNSKSRNRCYQAWKKFRDKANKKYNELKEQGKIEDEVQDYDC